MSYDVQIWSVDPVPLPEGLPQPERWRPVAEGWVRAARRWQIVVGRSLKAAPEDVPEEVAARVPGVRYLTELNLEPISAPASARKLLRSAARGLARAGYGVVLDQGTDEVITPAGVRRYRPERREERFALLALSWWFTEGPLLTEGGLDRFVGLLESSLPEAMPRRYGLFEPPQETYSEGGRERFLGFLQEHLDEVVVWYPQRPVVGVSLICSADWGTRRQGFRANHVRVEVEAQALEQPGWGMALEGFWRAASHLIQPFYGDVRTLKGFVQRGGTYGSDAESDFHPVNGPWWIGVPRRMGHAAVLGKPYLAHWPRFVEAAQREAGLAFLSTDDWTEPGEAADLAGGVPEGIAQRWIPEWAPSPYGGLWVNWNTEHPPIWPFQ